jgi:hypothetical protein
LFEIVAYLQQAEGVRFEVRSARPASRPKKRLFPHRPIKAITNLTGSVDGLPPGLASCKKAHLRATGYGQKRPR